jgi:hypothetical protein
VITCKSCGKPNPTELSNCRYCGAALAGLNNNPPRANAQEQIPAWLESLKAIERPTPPPSGQPDFPVADLVEQNALPGWMRPDSAAQKSESGKRPALRPAWMAGPNTDAGNAGPVAPGSLSAGSLIDSTSLPAWMRSDQPTGGHPGQIAASSLIEPDRLPGWLTGQPSSPPQSNQLSPLPQTQQPGQAFESSASPYSTRPPQAGALSQSTWQGPLNERQGQQGIAASSLLDVGALPQWLQEGSQAGAQSGPGGLSAGSLIDMNNLPGWLRDAEQEPRGGHPSSAPGVLGRPGIYDAPGGQGMPPRIESMRVPSRPRAEMAPLEQSEMAANVFSSMLGVASTPPAPADNYPTQQSFQPMPQPLPGVNQPWLAPTGSPQGQQGIAPVSPPNTGMPGTAGMPLAWQAPASPPGGFANAQQQMGYPVAASNIPASPNGQAQAGAKTAKRGFLETIRGWFHF